jgi:hypothetical protein
MQDQPNETVEEQGCRTEQTILTLVLSDGQSIWSVEELVSEIGRRTDPSMRSLPSKQRVLSIAVTTSYSGRGPHCASTNWTFDEQSVPGSKVGAPDCLGTDARRRADATGRKAAPPASAARSRAVRTTTCLSRPIRRRLMYCTCRFGIGRR